MSKNPVNTAVVAGDVAYVTNAYKGDLIQALHLVGAKGALEAEKGLLWSRKGIGSYVPIPVVHAGRLYFLRESTGVLGCLDAATGAPIYTGQRLADVRTVHASPVLVPTGGAGRLYCPARDGTTVVVKAGDAFEVLAANSLDDVFDASPVVVERELYLRGRSHLYCIAEPR
jgi:outer membrane protein assembly factor BamB